MPSTPLHLVLFVAGLWLALGIIGACFSRQHLLVTRLLVPAGALGAILVAVAGFWAIGADPVALVLPLGLPNLPFHLRIDSLSGFFLLLLGTVSAGIAIFTAGYLRPDESSAPGMQCLYLHVFLASMVLVIVSNDAYGFMVFWETMALSSYFLVVSDHERPEIRNAGFLYLLIAHIGAVAILLCFGVLQGGSGDYSFDGIRQTTHLPFWANVVFGLALAGFGAKAGLVPLHVWLPEAHPAAPSPASALMSAVMLKTAVYGFLRVTFDLLDTHAWWWGVATLALGIATALYGVIFSAVQSDMKRLLAWSSIENVGLIFAGLGLALLFRAYDMQPFAALALTAMLYHCINHAFFKSLLFLSTGSVLHATKERALGKLGGLMHRMPWVAWLALIGALSTAGVPPLNGFVSEWLLLQALLFTPDLPQGYLNMFVPVATACVVLTASLAGYVMVKFYGVVFLGRPREPSLAQAHDVDPWQRAGLAWLACGCVLLGLFPAQAIELMNHVTMQLLGVPLVQDAGWMLVAPITAERASFSPLMVILGLAIVIIATWWAVRQYFRIQARRAAAWDCGYPMQTARMQDTAEGFGHPVRHVFEPFFLMHRELPRATDAAPRYRVTVEDRLWHWIYLPIARLTAWASALASRVQQGRISIYLTYSFVTLIVLLFFVR
jgi:hydrogenase-4 component B